MECRAYLSRRYGLISMRQILLVRHGESEWNALGRWQGQADPPLSDHGRHQAARAAGRLGMVDVVVSSSLDRAQETATIIAQRLGVGPVAVDERLIERDAGEWSGLTRAEIAAAWPGYLAANPEDRALEKRPPGWEPDEELLVRANAALDEIVVGLPSRGTALVVTHGGVIYAIEAVLGAPRRYLPNLGARWLRFPDSTPVLGDRHHLYDPEIDAPSSEEAAGDSEAV